MSKHSNTIYPFSLPFFLPHCLNKYRVGFDTKLANNKVNFNFPTCIKYFCDNLVAQKVHIRHLAIKII